MIHTHTHRLALIDHQSFMGEWICSGPAAAEKIFA